MKKRVLLALLVAFILQGCSYEEPTLEQEVIENAVVITEETVSDDFIMPEEPSEEYFLRDDIITLQVAESGSEPDYLINGEWLPDMSVWEECPHPDYNIKLDHAVWNESTLSDEDVESKYRDKIEPIVLELLNIIYNTAGDTEDYTDRILQLCIDTVNVENMKAFHHYYDQMEFTFETYKNSLIYYYSDNTLTINGLAVISSSSEILTDNQRLHYIIPFTIDFIYIDGEWKISGIGGFKELYYGDTVRTYTNDDNSTFIIMGHKLITFEFENYLLLQEGTE